MAETVAVVMGGDEADGWAFATSAAAAPRWLGTPEGQPVRPGLRFALPNDPAVCGVVVAVNDGAVTLQTAGGKTGIAFEQQPGDEAGAKPTTRITVVPSPCDHVDDDRLHGAWRDAATRLSLLRRDAAERRSPRQAVVVIHGIGEQKPGSVLRGFVGGVVDAPQILSKPDDGSGDSELRRLQLFKTDTQPRTDFYELYWADKIRDTTKSQVVGWLKGLVVRPP